MSISDMKNSFIGTSLAEIITLPICTLKAVYQKHNDKTIIESLSIIYKERGITGFYQASVPAVIGQAITTSSKYTLYNYFNRKYGNYNYSNYINGGLSAVITSLFTHPLDCLKINIQTNSKTIWNEIKANPFLFFYRGYSKSFSKAVISGPLFFPLNDYFKKKFNSSFYGSLTASIIATTIMNPIDYLKTRHVTGSSFSYSNIPLLFKGLSLNLLRVVPHFTILMTTIDYLNKNENNRSK